MVNKKLKNKVIDALKYGKADITEIRKRLGYAYPVMKIVGVCIATQNIVKKSSEGKYGKIKTEWEYVNDA